MARVIPFSTTNLAASAFVEQHAQVNDSRFNPLPFTSNVRIYAVATAAQAVALTAGIGGEIQSDGVILPAESGLNLSTRDHQVASFVGLVGQKITVALRELLGVATTDLVGQIILDPL